MQLHECGDLRSGTCSAAGLSMRTLARRALFSTALLSTLSGGQACTIAVAAAAENEPLPEAAEDAAVVLLQVAMSSTQGSTEDTHKKASILIPQGATDDDFTGFEQPEQVFPFDALNREEFANGGSCVATVIHPRHAVTAAQCFAELGTNATNATLQVTINGKSHATSGVLFDPDWSCRRQGPAQHDIALLRFPEDLDITPAPLYETSDEKGKDFFMMGWGDLGRPNDTQSTIIRCNETKEGCRFRLARNKFSRAAHTLDYRFDDPDDPTNYDSLPDEGLATMGDAGSPAIILGQVAGVHSHSACCKYGSVGHYTRISQRLGWIKQAVTGNYSIKATC